MVIQSCLAKKNQNLNVREKSSVYSWKGRFVGVSGLKTQLSVINWTFFPRIQILIFLREATQNDHIRLLYKFENDQKKFGCVGSCGYATASVNTNWDVFLFATCIRQFRDHYVRDKGVLAFFEPPTHLLKDIFSTWLENCHFLNPPMSRRTDSPFHSYIST